MDGLNGRLALFPDTARVVDGELEFARIRAAALADEFGTPLLVYCERTIRARAREYVGAAPAALVVFGTKAFPNVTIMRLLAAEGLGADVSTLGELHYADAAGVPAERIVVHGNNKSDEELRAAAEAEAAYVVLDSVEELERARAAGVERMLARVTPGIEAETHDAMRTGHVGSKFGIAPAEVLSIRDELDGLHVHIGSQLLSLDGVRETIGWLDRFLVESGWRPSVIDVGGGLGVPTHPDERAPSIRELVETVTRGLRTEARLIFEPGRSLVAQAGVTLYRVGAVKRSGTSRWVAIDGGISDNPRPQLYGARYTALLANRVDEAATDACGLAGKHCESGDVLIQEVTLPEPRRGDVLAVPMTGAYTLAMGSNYNAVPRPAVVLVGDGDARLIRRRETVDDLLALDVA